MGSAGKERNSLSKGIYVNHICKLCGRSIKNLRETQWQHMEKHHGKKFSFKSCARYYFRGEFSGEVSTTL